MRTTSDAETILYQHIQGSALDIACSGGIWKWQRPDDSQTEDIVINSLPIGTDTIQRMVANVNIYVKDITVPNNTSNHKIQDSARIATLQALAMTLFFDYRGTDYDYRLTNQSVFEAPDIDQHFINNRIEFTFFPQ